MNFSHLKMIKEHPRINCPDCIVPMMPYQCRRVVVDRCLHCKGIWFDKKELGVFRDSLKDLPIEDIKINLESDSDPTVHTISTCSRCEDMLAEAKYAYNSKVILKKCQKCEGIWLPQAELFKFIDLVRIAKIIEPDVKGAVKEWIKFQEETRKQKEFNKTMQTLNQPRFRWPFYFR
jgi:uncharacterized protein